MTVFLWIAIGSSAGTVAILSTLGIIGLGIGSLIAGIIAIVKAINWKKDISKSIIKTYLKENFIGKAFEISDKYWNDTKKGFNMAAEQVERDWANKITEYERLADLENIDELKERIAMLEKGVDFFENIPSYGKNT